MKRLAGDGKKIFVTRKAIFVWPIGTTWASRMIAPTPLGLWVRSKCWIWQWHAPLPAWFLNSWVQLSCQSGDRDAGFIQPSKLPTLAVILAHWLTTFLRVLASSLHSWLKNVSRDSSWVHPTPAMHKAWLCLPPDSFFNLPLSFFHVQLIPCWQVTKVIITSANKIQFCHTHTPPS